MFQDTNLARNMEIAKYNLKSQIDMMTVDDPLQDGQEDLLQYIHGSRVLSRSQIKQSNLGGRSHQHHHGSGGMQKDGKK